MTEEITTRSWGSRLKDALVGILIGFVLIAAAIALSFWNERHSLHTAQSLEQAQKVLVSVPNAPIDEKNNMKVVYLSGEATTKDKLTDSVLGITVTAIGLNRQVEMYQWQEKTETRTESQMGGSERTIKTYTYNKTWSDSVIDSSRFKEPQGHQNPSSMPIPSQQQYAGDVKVGDFSLPESLITKIDISKPIDLQQVNVDALKNRYNKPVYVNGDQLYLGQDPQNPQPGDLRINLNAVYPQSVSIVAQQTGNTLQGYLAPAGETVLLLETGQQSPEQMFKQAQSENTLLAWLLRGVTLLMLIGGFSLILNPLVVLADVLPFLGTLVGFGTGFVAFLLGLSVWILVTAIAWFATRPWLSVGLIALLVVGGFLLIKARAKKAAIVSAPSPEGSQAP
ncbi:hypothetical protein Lrub_2821 [Legionella rubrilucens]|uniref:Transmembrane protein n=1 Tax=Legionella rubrilucens TaxID=458 RepID=A0A0W0XN82_9GAMM|nr:TMEM43 family protein [Legionella rubrilucens]KTD46024.1 hypothetical protein Lrub_2821 [Legionella rubrilucens]